METRSNLFAVAAIVGLLAFGLILFNLWLAEGSDPDGKIYEIRFAESVQGLGKGAAVEMLGVRVGQVKEVRLEPANPEMTLVRVAVTEDLVLRQGARASITRSLMDGTATVALRNGPSSAAQIAAPSGDVFPVILAEGSGRGRNAGPENIVGRVSVGVEKVSSSLGPEEQRLIGKQLADLAERSATWDEKAERALRAIPSKQRIAGVARSIEQVGSDAERLDRSLTENRDEVSRSIAEAADKVERTADSVDRSVSSARPALSEADRGQRRVGKALRTMRESVESVRDSVERVEQPR